MESQHIHIYIFLSIHLYISYTYMYAYIFIWNIYYFWKTWEILGFVFSLSVNINLFNYNNHFKFKLYTIYYISGICIYKYICVCVILNLGIIYERNHGTFACISFFLNISISSYIHFFSENVWFHPFLLSLLFKIDSFLLYYISIIVSPSSMLPTSSLPPIPSRSSLFLSLIRNKQITKI